MKLAIKPLWLNQIHQIENRNYNCYYSNMNLIAQQAVDVGKTIRKTRKSRRLRQDKLADILGLSIPTLRKVEAGDSTVSVHALLATVQYLGISDKVFVSPTKHLPLYQIPANRRKALQAKLEANGTNSRDAENSAWILSLSPQQRVNLLRRQEKERKQCGALLRSTKP